MRRMSTDRVTLQVKEREPSNFGSRNTRRLRNQGLIPGVLYGGKGEAQPFLVGERELRTALTGPSGMHAIVVTPPAAAAKLAVLSVSRCSWPGSPV